VIFDQVAKFASYGFNKSHAAAYAVLAYQTAYLKANHPVEFFAASMTLERANQDKLTLFRQEMQRAGVRLLPPDVNRSKVDFAVEDTPRDGPAIRYALSAIRNVGAQAMAALVEERGRGGPYRDLFDLTGRLCGTGALNKRLLEGLIRAGALDRLHPNRAQLLAAVDSALRYGAARGAQAASSQVSLFGSVLGEPELPRPELPAVGELPALERLQQEFEALGFYLSAHPLDGYRSGLKRLGVIAAADLVEHIKSGGPPLVRLAGMVLGKQERSTERSRFAFVQLSDPSGTFEVTLFSEVLGRARELLDGGRPLLVTGDARLEGEAVKILASSVEALDERIAGAGRRGTVEIRLSDAGVVERLTGLLTTNGEAAAKVRLILPLDEAEEVTLALPEGYGLPFARRVDLEGLPGVAAVRDL
jgi:DNA polymerase-3 subunit alpha